MISWTDIHKDFNWYQQLRWEEVDFTKEEAKEWIELSFEPWDLYNIKEWKNLNFSPPETKAWLEVGLDKYDWEFASWLRTKRCSPELVKNNLQLRNDVRYGFCKKCKEVNTSEKWCQPCAEQEWKQLLGQELINKFIQQQRNRLKWIPYEEFTDIEKQKELETTNSEFQSLNLQYNNLNKSKISQIVNRSKINKIKQEINDYSSKIEKLNEEIEKEEEEKKIKYLADGGFSKIYKAKVGNTYVILKSLNNSQNITLEFLTEIANTKLVDDSGFVVKCHGISQDPTTKNYLMVMKYMEGGNLREHLQNKDNGFSLKDKLEKLRNIALGLKIIHDQNLVHQDFHSGNILNDRWKSYITDLGLSQPVNHQKQTGQIFGVLPYVAPEVLQGQPYTQKADIYSFGIIAYELLTNSYPYPKMEDMDLSLKICNGYRPNLDKLSLPQLLKDLIKRCWDSNSEQRPSAEELLNIIDNWQREIDNKKNTPFYHQYQEIEAEYNTFSKNTPYQIHPNAITTSKMIDTKQITELLSHNLELDINDFNLDELNIQENPQEQSSTQAQVQIPPK